MDKLPYLNQDTRSRDSFPELRDLDVQIPENFVKGENVQTIRVVFNGKTIELHIQTRDFREPVHNIFSMLIRVLKEPTDSLEDSVANIHIVFEKIKMALRQLLEFQIATES